MRAISIILAAFIALFVFQIEAQQQGDLLIQTNYGKVQGVFNTPGTHRVWRGIPFATPPIGNLRWTSPRAPANWNGIKYTNTSSLPCTQSASSATSSEDCLYLNVFAPAKKSNQLLPVIVWVYGGAYISGSNANINGSYISGEDVIFVAINYRVGMMGYFGHNALANSNAHSSGVGFYGIQDIGASLEWVRDNIRNFGGDTNLVTLGGQSAGSFAICAFIATPKAWGLFHRLLMDSTHCTVDTQEQGLARGNKLATALGCSGLSDADALTCLLGKSQSEIYTAQAAYNYGTLPYQTLTGRFWPSFWPQHNGLIDQPATLIKKGGAPRVPMLIGNVLNESSTYNCPTLINMNTSYFQSLYYDQMYSQARSSELIEDLADIYDFPNTPTPIEGFNNFMTDFVYKCHASSLAKAYATTNNVYMYMIEHTVAFYKASRTPAQVACLGVPHGSDLNFYGYTDGTLQQLTADELVLSAAMRKAWVTFAKTGVPSFDAFSWPKYEKTNRKYVRYNVGAITLGDHLREEQCDALQAAIGGDSLNQPGSYPECSASVSLVARPGGWSSNNQNYQVFDVSITNTGAQAITGLKVNLNLNGASFDQKWNLEEEGNGVYKLPNWSQGFNVGATGTSSGFILKSSGALNPAVSFKSITC